MSVVWKFDVPAQDSFEIQTPGPAQPLSVQMQLGMAQLWMLVTPTMKPHTYRFRVVRTGEHFTSTACSTIGHEHATILTDTPVAGAFVGTFQPEPGLAFHLFMEQQS